MTIKKDVKSFSVNPLYLIFRNVNGNKYLTLVLTNKSKEKIKKYEKLWSKIRDLIKSATKKSDDYYEKYMKIKIDYYDSLPIENRLTLHVIISIISLISLHI